MQKFFEKHIDSFEAKDAIKLIDKHVDKAKDLCSEYDMSYLNHLATAFEMINDYFLEKGLDVRTHKKA